MRDAIQAQLGKQGKDYFAGVNEDTIPFLAHPKFFTSCKVNYSHYDRYYLWVQFTSSHSDIMPGRLNIITQIVVKENFSSLSLEHRANRTLISEYYYNPDDFKANLAKFQQECFLVMSKVHDHLLKK